MTKTWGIAFAVSALVTLAGCSASPIEPLAAETTAPISASASMSAPAKVEEKAVSNPDEQIEKQFTEFALMRADVHSVSVKPSEKVIVGGLHAFCKDGKPFKISKSSAFNENLDTVADTAYCDYLAK